MYNVVKIVLGLVWCLLAGVASAQTATTTSFEGMMNNIIRSTPGVTNVTISGGVRTGTSAAVEVAARGLTIPVATTVTADVGVAAIARGAARVGMRAVPWVGTALVIGEVVDLVKSSGYQTCPPPQFFCQPDPNGPNPADVYGGYTTGSNGAKYGCGTASLACDAQTAAIAECKGAYGGNLSSFSGKIVPTAGVGGKNPWYDTGWRFWYFEANCINTSNSVQNTVRVVMVPPVTCPDGYYLSNNQCVKTGATTPMVPVTEDDINTKLAAKLNADANETLRIKKLMDDVARANPAYSHPVDMSTAPLSVNAPAVTSPARTVSTEQIANPDGSTSTKTVKETTTVTPVVGSPSTVGNPNVTYPSTTTQTTTIVNNTTNATTTTTATIANPAQTPAPVKPSDLPTDYNREATQQKILDALTAPINETPPDGAADLASVKTQNDAGAAEVGKVTEASSGLKSWLPTIKTAACVNPTVPIPIVGGTQAVPICDSVDVFAKFISAVISVFALYGCIREVQAALKA